MKWLLGYLLCRCEGGNIERFLNLCRHHGISVWKVVKRKDVMTFCMMQKDYKKLLKFVCKTHVYPRIIERYGVPFYVQRTKKDWTFYVGFTLFWGVMLYLSTFVWRMEFSGQMFYTKETLAREITALHMGVGTKRKHLKCDEIEKYLREKYARLSWVSAEEKGCVLQMKLKEGTAESKVYEKTEPRDVLAAETGVVKKIVTRQGTALVRAGQKVKKGDVLIQGMVDYVNDEGVIYKKKAVVADGEVLLEGQKRYQDRWEKEKFQRVHTGERINIYHVQCGGFGISIKNPLKRLDNSANYDILNYVCFDDSFFSLQGSRKIYYLTERKKVTYSREQAESILKKRFLNWCESLIEQHYDILEQSWSISSEMQEYKGNGVVRFQTNGMKYRKRKEFEQPLQDSGKDEKNGTKSNHS